MIEIKQKPKPDRRKDWCYKCQAYTYTTYKTHKCFSCGRKVNVPLIDKRNIQQGGKKARA